ncbi:hypothetical protein TIFTF001_038201 [Ficus carica]|uniref:Uncharacterized protein n=1 Tax=Ficus carica TaxID=3494 RepID=A0AA88E6Y6_FICCA|nr:hypothetical protein TIFTF001_038174 [Ficus carica]GMN69129.1 hypothetical protein TIFTF001_038185 [Ficus carica]GMN69144.1 hypothetical protein TIFTF001_038190 [Ficus carica]GMN69145.1 hypothetical protein TIFTF001_038201 [Ficus carica]
MLSPRLPMGSLLFPLSSMKCCPFRKLSERILNNWKVCLVSSKCLNSSLQGEEPAGVQPDVATPSASTSRTSRLQMVKLLRAELVFYRQQRQAIERKERELKNLIAGLVLSGAVSHDDGDSFYLAS